MTWWGYSSSVEHTCWVYLCWPGARALRSRSRLSVRLPTTIVPARSSSIPLQPIPPRLLSTKASSRKPTAARLATTRMPISSRLRMTPRRRFVSRLSQTLTSQGYNAICAQRGTFVAGGNILIVDGALTNISEGNRLRRLVIGFGTGASTLDSNVSMYQRIGGNLNQVLAFSTHADSGKIARQRDGAVVKDRLRTAARRQFWGWASPSAGPRLTVHPPAAWPKRLRIRSSRL